MIGTTNYLNIGSNSNVYLIKTDGNGNELWYQTYGGTGTENGRFVQQTNDGGYILTGWTSSFGNGGSDIYLIKTDGGGNELWTKMFGGSGIDNGYSVQQTTDGGYIIIGSTESYGNGSSDVFLVKTDENGNQIWSQTFGGTNDDSGFSIQQTSDEGYIICGRTYSFGNGNGSDDVYLIKTDVNGNELWTKTFGETNSDIGWSVKQTTDEGYIITGWITSLDFNINIYLIKTDVNGNELWTKTFGGIVGDYSYSVQQTQDGGYIITGMTTSFGSGVSDVYLIKTDGNGNELWSKTFGGIEDDYGRFVQQTNDGGYIITGYSYSFGGVCKIYLIKTDDQGNITSTFEIPLPNPNRKLEKTINLKGQEIIPQTNTPIIEIYDDGSLEKKIILE